MNNLTQRGQIHTTITNSIITNPDAITNFIALVCNEVSLVELERIFSKLKKANIESNFNLDN